MFNIILVFEINILMQKIKSTIKKILKLKYLKLFYGSNTEV